MSRYRSIDDLRQKCGDAAADQVERKLSGDVRRYRGPISKELKDMLDKTPPVRKYRNEPVEHDGQRFDSKLERDAYVHLCRTYGARNVIRQVSLPFGGNRLRVDFMVLCGGGIITGESTLCVRFYDAKGRATPEWRAKANHLRDKHGIEIQLITRKDIGR